MARVQRSADEQTEGRDKRRTRRRTVLVSRISKPDGSGPRLDAAVGWVAAWPSDATGATADWRGSRHVVDRVLWSTQ